MTEPLTLEDYKFLKEYYNRMIQKHENILLGLKVSLEDVEENIKQLNEGNNV